MNLRGDKQEPIISEFIHVADGVTAQLTNLSFVARRQCPDAFIFCTSATFSDELFEDWHKRDELDACYEIADVEQFAAAISRRIAASAWYAGNFDIIYRDEYIDYESPVARVSPGLTKSRDAYAWQKENRMVWNPLLPSPPLEPWIIDVPEAIRYCRPLAFREKGTVKRVAPAERPM